jgi:hypothetical protein
MLINMSMADGYSKGGTIHRTKKKAQEVAKSCKECNIPYRIVQLANGYRVDKKY